MKLYKLSIPVILLPALIFTVVLRQDIYPSPYQLSASTDSILISSGAALCGLSLYTGKDVDPLSDQEITGLSKNDINRFDRSAADNRSPSADKWSDRVLAPVMISPFAFMIDNEMRNDFVTTGIMYAESILITRGLNGTVKNIVHRNRPYTYNPDVPGPEKKNKDAVLSFYSGHTAHSFNSAVFISTVFSDYYQGSYWRFAVWGTTLSAASLTGYLRYRAGMHYPSDILAGAVIGSTTGWMIPALHRSGNTGISVQIIPGEQNMIAVVLNY